MADDCGLLPLPWSFLSKEQLLSAAEMFDIKLTTTQIQNCHNLANALGAKIRKSSHYINQYGKNSSFSDICFDFSLDNLFCCIGNGKDDAENMLGEFLLTPKKQKQCSRKESSLQACQDADSSSVTKRSDNSGSLCNRIHPLPNIVVAVLLSAATPEQLKSIASFYNIKIEIRRRSSKNFIIGLIKESSLFLADLATSLVISEVIYCFDANNNVVCSFQDITSLNATLSLSSSSVTLFSPMAVSDLTTTDKVKILLQKALATTKDRCFTVPWCALTLSQKNAVLEDYSEDDTDFKSNSAVKVHKSTTVMWNHVKLSSNFISQFGSPSVDTLSFIGSTKTPLDISIHLLVDSSDFNSNLSAFFHEHPLTGFIEEDNPRPSCVILNPTLSEPSDKVPKLKPVIELNKTTCLNLPGKRNGTQDHISAHSQALHNSIDNMSSGKLLASGDTCGETHSFTKTSNQDLSLTAVDISSSVNNHTSTPHSSPSLYPSTSNPSNLPIGTSFLTNGNPEHHSDSDNSSSLTCNSTLNSSCESLPEASLSSQPGSDGSDNSHKCLRKKKLKHKASSSKNIAKFKTANSSEDSIVVRKETLFEASNETSEDITIQVQPRQRQHIKDNVCL